MKTERNSGEKRNIKTEKVIVRGVEVGRERVKGYNHKERK